MKRKTLRLSAILMALVMFIAMSVTAMAASSEAVTKDNIKAQLFTDKDAYALGEMVNAYVQVDNGTGKEVSVDVQIRVPEGLNLAGADNFKHTLKADESWTTSGGVFKTSGGMAAAVPYMALAVLMSCGALAISVFGKKREQTLSIVLCLAMLGGMVTAAVPAEAADVSGNIPLSCAITVDGMKAEVTVELSYVIHDTDGGATVNPPAKKPDATPTANPAAVPDMPEDPYNLIKNGSFEIKGAKNEYIFADWTAEAPAKTAADNTTPKFGLTALKISNKTGRVSQIVDVEPGNTYELSGYIWMNGKVARMEVSGYSDMEGTQETDAVVMLEMNTEKNKGSVNLTDENGERILMPVSQTWNKFTYVFTAGKETEYVKILLNTVGGFSLYDGVALRPVEAIATMDEPEPDKPANLIVNGGFEVLAESKEDDIFAGWKAADATKAHLSMDMKRFGCYSLRVSNKTALVTQIIDVEPKKTYKLTGQIYMYGTGARMFLAGYYDAETTIETLAQSTLEFNTTKIKGQLTFNNEYGEGLLMPTSNTWNEFSYTFTTGPLTEYVKLSLTGLSQSSFFDNLVLQPAEEDATMVEPEPEYPESLIRNGGFESIAEHKDDDIFAGWEIKDFEKAFLEPDIKRFGYHSLRVSNKTAIVHQRVDVEPGRTYELAGYVYMRGNAARVMLGSYADYEMKTATDNVKALDINATKNSNYLTFDHKKGIGVTKPLSQSWNRFHYTFTVGEDTEYLDVILTGLSSSSYYDTITLHKVPGYVNTGLISNGDFETAGDTADDVFAGWMETKEIEATDLKVTGYDNVGKAVQVAHKDGKDNCVEQMLDVIANKEYDLTGYVYMDGQSAAIDLTGYTDETAQTEAGAATVIFATDGSSTERLTFTDEKGNPVDNPVAETWYKFTYKLKTDANAEYLKMVLRGVQGATIFDSLSLQKSVWIPDTGLIVNGAFETEGSENADDIFANWMEIAPAGSYGNLSTTGYDDVGTAFKTNSSKYSISQKVEVEAGKTYELTGYIHMKPNSSGGMKSYLIGTGYAADNTQLEDSGFKTIAFQSAPTNVTLTDIETQNAVTTMESEKWYQFSTKFKVAADVKYLELLLRGSGGTMTIDNLCLHEAVPDPEVPPADTGLIVNGAFEKFTGTDFDAWTEAGRTDRVYPADAQKYDGEASLYINGSGNKVSQMVSVEPGKTYELTGYIYLNRTGIKLSYNGYQDADKAAATATKKAMQVNAAGTASSAGLIFTDPKTGSSLEGLTVGGWSQFSYTVTTTADTKFLEVMLEGNGSAYVDNFSLFEIETDPSATPTPTAEPTATPEVTPTPTAEPGTTPTPSAEPTATPTPSAEPTATPGDSGDGNLIVNGEFGEADNYNYGGWTSTGSAAPSAVGNGLKLAAKSVVYQEVDVEPNKTYELTGYVLLPSNGINKLSYQGYKEDRTTQTTTKSTADNSSKFGTYLIHSTLLPTYASDDDFKYVDSSTGAEVTATELTASTWYQFSCTLETDADTEILKLYLSGHSGTSYFDNISLKEIETEPEATPAPSAVPTAEPTATPEVTPAPTAEPTATPEVTPAPTAEPTATPEPTPAPTAEPTATPEVTPAPTAEPTATPEVTPAPTAEPTATPEVTPAPTAEPTATPEVTATPVPTEAPTATPEVTPAPTAEPTATPEVTPAPTAEPTATPEPTPTPVTSLIANGGFENGTGGLEGWTQAGNKNYAKPRGLAAYEGTYGLYLKNQGNNVSQTVDVEPGKTYELTGYVHVLEAGSTGKGKIILSYNGLQEDGVTPTTTTKAMYHDPNAMNPAITYTDLETGESAALTHGKWYQFSCVVTTDADTEYLNVVFAGYNEGYYDNISLCEVIDPNLIKNGGFETVADKDFDAWTENFGNEALAGSTADVVHDGNYALYINNGANSISQMVEVEPGETYELTGYVYLNRKGLKLNYYGYQDADKTTATETKKPMELNDVASKASSAGLTFTDLEGNPVDGPAVLNWYKFSCKVTADADTKFLDLVLMGNGSGYYDNISLLKETATQ